MICVQINYIQRGRNIFRLPLSAAAALVEFAPSSEGNGGVKVGGRLKYCDLALVNIDLPHNIGSIELTSWVDIILGLHCEL